MARSPRRSKPTAAEIDKRDRKRDIGAELLESIRQVKAGKVGAIHGPPGILLLRCIDLAPLGAVSAKGLEVGRLYVGQPDRDGWVRVLDHSHDDYLYPRACFEVVSPGGA